MKTSLALVPTLFYTAFAVPKGNFMAVHLKTDKVGATSMHYKCVDICPDAHDSYKVPMGRCVTDCEAEMYRCHSLPAKKAAACEEKAKETFTWYETEKPKPGNGTNGTNGTNGSNATFLMAVEHKVATGSQAYDCNEICPPSLESVKIPNGMCVTDCESEMYVCHSKYPPKVAAECEKKAGDKFKHWYTGGKSGNGTNGSNATFLMAIKVGNKKAPDCKRMCQPNDDIYKIPDSQCVTTCQSEFYRCHSLHPEEKAEECEKKAEEKYNWWGKKKPAPANGTNGSNGTNATKF